MARGKREYVRLAKPMGYVDLDKNEFDDFLGKKRRGRRLGGLASLGKNLSPVTDIMKKRNDIPMVKENYSISKVILEISSKRLGCALVINKNKKIVGFCSDGDLRRFMRKNKNFHHKCAKDMMSKQPTTINEKSLIIDALKIMNQKKITVLIVEKNKKIKGLIHMHDIISFLGI